MNFFDETPAPTTEEGRQLIKNAEKAIGLDKSNPDRDRLITEAMNAMYDHFTTGYSEEDLENFQLQLEIFTVEIMLAKEFLPLENEPEYDETHQPVLPERISSDEDAEKTLDFIVHNTRKWLSRDKDIKTDPLDKRCIDTSWKVERICKENGIDFIHFGVDQKLKHGNFHHFTMVRLPFEDGTTKNYIVDCTYRQFFTKSLSNLKRIGAMRGPAKGCSVGAYMMLTDKRKQIAESILKKGYVEATPETVKEYFDAIVFSGRDKRFYDEHGLDYLNPDDLIPGLSAEFYLQHLISARGASGESIHKAVDEILSSPSMPLTRDDLRGVDIRSSEKDSKAKIGGEDDEQK